MEYGDDELVFRIFNKDPNFEGSEQKELLLAVLEFWSVDKLFPCGFIVLFHDWSYENSVKVDVPPATEVSDVNSIAFLFEGGKFSPC